MTDLHDIMRRTIDYDKFDSWLMEKHKITTNWPVGIAKVSEGGGAWRFCDEGREHIVMAFGQQDKEGGDCVKAESLMAFRTSTPDRVCFLEQYKVSGAFLGECSFTLAECYRRPLTVHDTPFEWLLSGCRGIWPTDDEAIDRLRDIDFDIIASAKMSERIKKRLTRLPKIKTV